MRDFHPLEIFHILRYERDAHAGHTQTHMMFIVAKMPQRQIREMLTIIK